MGMGEIEFKRVPSPAAGQIYYQGEARGATYRVVSLKGTTGHGEFRAYRMAGDRMIPASYGCSHKTRREAFEQCERDLEDVLADRKAASAVEPVEPTPPFYAARMADAIKTLAERSGVPLELLAPPPTAVGDEDADLPELFQSDHKLLDRIVRRAAYDALKTMLATLDGWIEGARENHDAMQHRGESTGGECWQSFAPEDIRTMVNDAARQFGTREPWDGVK